MNEPIIQNCRQSQVERMAAMRQRGRSYQAIANATKSTDKTVNRYLRVLKRYGLGAFAEG